MGIMDGVNPKWVKKWSKNAIQVSLASIKHYRKYDINKYQWDNSHDDLVCQKCKSRNGTYDVPTTIKMVKSMHQDCANEYCRCSITPIVD